MGSYNMHTKEEKIIHPNKKELEMLGLLYDKFFHLYEEIRSKEFLKLDAGIRFMKLSKMFAIYNEAQLYPPIRYVLDGLDKIRPKSEKFIALNLFNFIRNVLAHYPVFDSWNEAYVTKNLAPWSDKIKNKSILRFLGDREKLDDYNRNPKFRIFDNNNKKFEYFEIRFPSSLKDDDKVYLKDIFSEKVGIRFCIIFMMKYLSIQLKEDE